MNCGLQIILWIIQFITISVYIYAVTFVMAVKGDLGVLGPSYPTILIFFFLLFILMGNEAVLIIRQILTPDLYLNSQIVKISLFIMTFLSIEVFGIAWRKRDINHSNAILTRTIWLTLLASIPFGLGLVLAWILQRTSVCGISVVVTPVDEEVGETRPLLGNRAYTT